MTNHARKFDAAFKARIALEALREVATVRSWGSGHAFTRTRSMAGRSSYGQRGEPFRARRDALWMAEERARARDGEALYQDWPVDVERDFLARRPGR